MQPSKPPALPGAAGASKSFCKKSRMASNCFIYSLDSRPRPASIRSILSPGLLPATRARVSAQAPVQQAAQQRHCSRVARLIGDDRIKPFECLDKRVLGDLLRQKGTYVCRCLATEVAGDHQCRWGCTPQLVRYVQPQRCLAAAVRAKDYQVLSPQQSPPQPSIGHYEISQKVVRIRLNLVLGRLEQERIMRKAKVVGDELVLWVLAACVVWGRTEMQLL